MLKLLSLDKGKKKKKKKEEETLVYWIENIPIL